MLRAASSKIPHYTSLRRILHPHQSDPLSIPFLCPSVPRSSRWVHNSSTGNPSDPPSSSTSSGPHRTYSTATYNVPIPDTPFGGIDGSYLIGKPFAPKVPIKRSDKPALLIVDTPKLPETTKKKGRYLGGISEDKHEVLSTFEACIKVGRIARAQLMLNMITNLLDNASPLLIGAHNTFLGALLSRALADGSQDSLRVFFTWYEDTMKRELNLTGDAMTMALLLEGSFAVAEENHGVRLVQAYVNHWREQRRDINEVFGSSIVSEEHIVRICKFCGIKPEELSERHASLLLQDTVEPEILQIPEVLGSDVKGLSLKAIRQSLVSLTDPNVMPSRHTFGQDDVAFHIERQKVLEQDVLKSAHERWKAENEKLAELGLAPKLGSDINSLLYGWHQSMVPLIKQELERVNEAEENPASLSAADRCLYGPFLRLMTPEKIAAIVILEIIRMQNLQLGGEGTKSSHVVMTVGRIIEQEYYAQELAKRKNRDVFKGVRRDKLAAIFSNLRTLRAVVKAARQKRIESPPSVADVMLEWPSTVRAKLGAVLISMLLHCAKTAVTKVLPGGLLKTQLHPAIQHCYAYVKGRRLGVIKLHHDIVRKLATEPIRGYSLGRQLPMVVCPLPWLAWNEGGYYFSRSRVVRTKGSKEQDIYVQTASDRGDLDQLFQGLDVLGRTAWRINRKVFDVVLEVWNAGEEFAKIPPRETTIDIPPEPEPDENPRVHVDWLREVRRLKALEKSNHSQRCTVNLKMEIARAFLFETLYFPHNVDFRGRAYPLPPNLNHIGDDLSRGLLMFADGKELGENGLRWLKIHCANMVGYDKASFTDRVKYIDDHIDDVFDSATDPLGGRRWWQEAEDPWQCLATCFSITEALKSPDPTKYKCHTTVAQDGTCNGLQHYAALGGDFEGAKQVNLEPADKPQDVYTGVAELVKARVKADAEAGHDIAKLVDGHITRKVVKQSVMTNVYGVTFVGARAQIQKQLLDNEKIPREKSMVCAAYIAVLVFDSIKEFFTGATKIQTWLAKSARMIARSVSPAQYGDLADHSNGKLQESKSRHVRRQGKVEFMTSVVWTTPLGMAVVQPYREARNCVVQTNLQKVYISDPSAMDQVNSRKQMTAFPPNFIHSLDATHMLMSAIKCHDQGLAFASVHDSFWTHPSDVDKLNSILRDAFIQLHSVNLMEKLKEEFETRYSGYKYLVNIPRTGRQAILIRMARAKRASERYNKRALTMVEDLEWELERDRLLASADPDERQKGEKMITPFVIVSRAGGADKIEAEEPLGAELGKVDESAPEPADESVLEPADAADVFGTGDEVVGGEFDAGDAEEVEPVVSDEDTEPDTEIEVDAKNQEIPQEVEEAKGCPEEVKGESGWKTKKPKKKPVSVIRVWAPLEFPPLPPKGKFDVEVLRKSEYFFS